MNLVKVFLNEGEKDEYYRKLAYRCADTLINYFRQNRKPAYVGIDDGDCVTACYVGRKMNAPNDLKEYFDDLLFFITASPTNGRNGAVYEKVDDNAVASDIITLFVNRQSAEAFDEPEWEFMCHSSAYEWVKEARIGMVHEFVHEIDAHRAKDPKYWSKPQYNSRKVIARDPEETKKYFNSTVEYNAYVQQELERLDSELRGLQPKSMDDIKNLLGVSDAGSFIEKFLKMVYSPFRKNMTTDTRKRVVKRANQYWQDLERRFSG